LLERYDRDGYEHRYCVVHLFPKACEAKLERTDSPYCLSRYRAMLCHEWFRLIACRSRSQKTCPVVSPAIIAHLKPGRKHRVRKDRSSCWSLVPHIDRRSPPAISQVPDG